MATFTTNTDIETLTRTGSRFTDSTATNVTGGVLSGDSIIFETPAIQLNGGGYSLNNCALNVVTNPAGTNEFRNGTFTATNCQLNFANATADASQIVWGGDGSPTVGNLTIVNLTNSLVQRGTGTGALLINGRQWDPVQAVLVGTTFGQNVIAQLRFGSAFTGIVFASTQTNTQGGQVYNWRWVNGVSNSGWSPFWGCDVRNWTAAAGVNFNLTTGSDTVEYWIMGGELPSDGNIAFSTRSTHSPTGSVRTRVMAPWNPQFLNSVTQGVIADGNVTLIWSSPSTSYALLPASFTQATIPTVQATDRAHNNGDSYLIQSSTSLISGANLTQELTGITATARSLPFSSYPFQMFSQTDGTRRTVSLTPQLVNVRDSISGMSNSYSPLSTQNLFGFTATSDVAFDPEVTQALTQTQAVAIAGGTGTTATLDHLFLVSKANNLSATSMPFGRNIDNDLVAFGNVTFGSTFSQTGNATTVPVPTAGMTNGVAFTGLNLGNNVLDLGGNAVSGLDVTAGTSAIINPNTFSAFQADLATNFSFRNLELNGVLTVNASSDVYVTFSGVTTTGLTINRGTGTGTVFIQGISAGGAVTFGSGVQAFVPIAQPSTITVRLSQLPIGTAYAVSHNGFSANSDSGIVDAMTTDRVFSTATSGEGTITSIPVILHTVTRNTFCAHKGITVGVNTSATEVLNVNLDADSPQVIQGVPAGSSGNLTLTPESEPVTFNSMGNLVHIVAAGSPTNSKATGEQVTIAAANARGTEAYVRVMFEQVRLDSSLVVPTTGTSSLLHDAFQATQFGVDFRTNRYVIDDRASGSTTEPTRAQFLRGAQTVNDNQEFTTTGLSANQLTTPITRMLTGTEDEQVVFGDRTDAPTPEQNAGALRPDLVNIGLNVPILTGDGTSFETTPNLPTGGG